MIASSEQECIGPAGPRSARARSGVLESAPVTPFCFCGYPYSWMTARALHELSLSEAARGLAAKEFTSTELVRACLARIAERDASVRAWAHLDRTRALEQAARCDGTERAGPLHGVPIGIKDIVDTRDLPTEYGSQLLRGHRPDRDAECIERLRRAGAVILGKTVTTEFAYFAPGPTTNPHNAEHTPGGSSSGSAAAVADFQVPCALGTQTAGSVIRPASFTGIVGYKPTHGAFPMRGVHPLAPSFDTLGAFCREIGDLALLGSALTAGQRFGSPLPAAAIRAAAVLRTPDWNRGEPEMRDAFDRFVDHLRDDGVPIDEREAPAFEGLADAQQPWLAREACAALGPIAENAPSKVQPETLKLIEAGRAVSAAVCAEVRERVDAANVFLRDQVFRDADVIVTPSAPGEAPLGLGATGDPIFNRIWTMLGVPCVTFPIATGAHGLPLGVQIVGERDRDEALLARAQNMRARTLFELFPPQGPGGPTVARRLAREEASRGERKGR